MSTLELRRPAAEPDPPVYLSLRELYNHPELLAPPEAIVPRIAYRGRVTALAGPDKAGKSTLMAHAAAALSRGRPWLGEPTTPRRVVLLGLEEATGDIVRRYRDLDADPDRIRLLVLAPPDLLARTDALLAEWPADLLIVDSLSEYARVTRGVAPDLGDASGWGEVMRPLVALARAHDIAVVILHHVRRSDGQYRGSSEIAAAVDCILEMVLPDGATHVGDATTRHMRGRGRWTVEPWAWRLAGDRIELVTASAADRPVSLDARVLAYVTAHPGASHEAIRRAVQARATAVDAAIGRLVQAGAIEDRGTARRRAYHAAGAQVALEVMQ